MKKVLIAVALMLTLGACTNVKPGWVGVKVDKLGSDRTVSQDDVVVGNRFYNPITTSIIKYPISVQRVEWVGEATLAFNVEGITLEAPVAFSAQAQPDSPHLIVQRYRNYDFDRLLDTYLKDAVKESLSEAATNRTVVGILTTDRVEFMADAEQRLKDKLEPRGFLIEDLTLAADFIKPPEITTQLNDIIAEQNRARAASERIKTAEAEALRLEAEAQGIANSKVIAAQGEAESLRILNDALAENPDVLQLRTIEKWSGSFPQVMGGGADPFSLLVQPPAQR
jgi:regulator of protease activity HflC (stomatin/prohibitin superfamily)